MFPIEHDATSRPVPASSSNGGPLADAGVGDRVPARAPIAREGWPFVGVPLAAGALLLGAGRPRLAAAAFGVAGFMAFFFRDPERTPPPVRGAILAPADGRVMAVVAGLDDPFVGRAQRVSIFLSPLDVHVNRAPVDGEVVGVEHRRGAFLAAYRPEASWENERTAVSIQGEGLRVVVCQIAGVLARRIVCRVEVGVRLRAGERFGMIRFGSRTDLVVPAEARVTAQVGDHVRAGETILGVFQEPLGGAEP